MLSRSKATEDEEEVVVVELSLIDLFGGGRLSSDPSQPRGVCINDIE